MPIYEYQGVQYSIDTDDQAAAKAKILAHLGTQGAPVPTDKPADFSAKETALALGQGIVGAGKSLTDVFGAENVASQALGKVQTALGEQFSPERKAEMARREEIQKKAAESGSITEEISAFLGSVADAPVQSLAQGLGSIVPYVGTGIIGAIAKLGGRTVTAINTVLGTAQGAGAVKGSIYDGVRDELVKSGMKLEEAEAKAAKAQEYLGGNLLDIAGGAALGGVGARFGVEKLLTPGAAAKLDAGLLSRMGKAALAEAPLEGAQAGQEQVAVNRALQQAGFDVDTFKGAAGAAARDAAIGALTGAAVGSVRGPGTPTAPLTEEGETAPPPPPPPGAPPVTAPGGVSPEAMDLETLLSAAAPAVPVAEETIDFETPTPAKTSGKAVDDLIADNARIQAKLDAGEYKNPKATAAAKAKQARQQAEIDAQAAAPVVASEVIAEQAAAPVKESIYAEPIKAAQAKIAALEAGEILSIPPATLGKLMRDVGLERPKGMKGAEAVALLKGHIAKIGAQDATQQTDVGTSGVGTEVLGGPTTTGAAAGVARDGRPGVVSDQGTKLASEAGTGSQQSTLAALERDRVEAEATEAARLAALDEIAGKNIPQAKTEEFIRDEYEASRQAITAEQTAIKEQLVNLEAERARLVEEESANEDIDNGDAINAIDNQLYGLEDRLIANVPEWTKLTADEKDVFLGALKTSQSAQDFDKATKELSLYRKQKSGKKLNSTEQRVVNGYESNRNTFSKSIGIEFPKWSNLSEAAKNIYLGSVKKNTAAEQTAAFEKIADKLEEEGKGIRGVSRVGVEELKLKGAEQVSLTKAQEELAKSLADRAQAVGKGKPLPNSLIMMLITGDVNGVLKQLGEGKAQGLDIGPQKGERGVVKAAAERQSILTKLVSQFLSQALNTIKYDSKVVVADPNNAVIQRLEREGKLAEYDPKTDTFYFTEKGLDEATFLHEVVHAGTVKLIYQYLNNPSSLTKNQREALDHLQKIFDFSKKRLGGKFKNAYENLYEFIGYALTESKFQDALANMQVRPLANYTTKAQNLWQQITQVLSDLYGLVTAKARTLELRPEIFDAFAKSMAPMNKEGLYEETSEEEGITTLEGEIATESDYAQRGAETELKEKKQKYKPGKAFLSSQPGYEGNLLLEVTEAFKEILAAPEVGIDVAPLAAKAAQPKVPKKEAPSVVEKKLREDEAVIPPDTSDYDPGNIVQAKNVKYFTELLFTKPGWRRIAAKLQNERYAIKHWQDLLELANKTIYEGKNKINNIFDQITLSTGRAKNLYNEKVESIYENLDKAVFGLSKALDLPINKTLDMAHRVLEAMHEPERREVKYLMTVPLSTTANIKFGTSTISAADFRDRVFKALDTKSFTEAQAKKLRDELNKIVFTTDANGNRVPNTKYVDSLGSSPRQVTKAGGQVVGVDTDINNDIYNVTGLTSSSVAARMANYEALANSDPEVKKQMDAVIKNIKSLHTVTTELNKQANYWSQPVSNRVAFYGFDNYVPLKGVSKPSKTDELLDFDGNSMGREIADIPGKGGKELQEVAYSFDGRISVSDNPVLQSMSDAVRAAMRAGRKDLTQSIKNSLGKSTTTIDGKKVDLNPNGQGLLPGKVLMNVTFEQRRDDDFIKSLPRENTIFHYNEDGSIDVLEISDRKLREAIRRTYKDTNPLVDIANSITSRLGQLHTRYNYNFAPLNFVRDALTNAWTIGAEMGPANSAKFIADISTKVVSKGAFSKAMKVAALYEGKDIKKIEELAKTDPLIKEMVEFIKEGGMVEYLQGISLKSNFQRLQKDIGRSGIMRNVGQLNKFIDIWTDMFELTSRSAAYSIAKKNFLEQNMTETAARTKAAAYAKNLANFEQVGEYGRGLGAAFMFFRPSATGAVRAIEAALPAFQNVDKAVKGLPSSFTEADKAAFKKNFLAKQKSSRYMLTYLMGLGALSYTMAAMMADEDDLGRNKLMNDDMGQWTRFLRFHTPFSDKPFQIPWGFGLGSFMASGAQIAAVMSGHQSIGSALGNVATQISLDSFVPIPFSRMKIEDNPALFALDSITPSMLRPALQFVVNKNGLGQDIYNDSNRRMGSAYLGGDNIPQTYKVLATSILDTFGIDVSPNSLYFIANSYADGPMRVVDAAVNSMYLAADKKEFNAKTDIPLIGSFIGAAPNVDGREFNSITEKVEKMAARLNMLEKANPDEYIKYLDKNPLHEEIVEFFDKNIGELNKLRKETNEVRVEPGLSPKERTQSIRELNKEQNLLKYELIQQFKAYYDLKP
jgi:hypothetical protein